MHSDPANIGLAAVALACSCCLAQHCVATPHADHAKPAPRQVLKIVGEATAVLPGIASTDFRKSA